MSATTRSDAARAPHVNAAGAVTAHLPPAARRRRRLPGVLVALAALLALPVMADEGHRSGPPGHPPHAMMGMGGHGGPMGMNGNGGPMGMGGPGGPMAGMLLSERALDSVQATAEQKAQIRRILEGAAAQRKAGFEQMRALREEAAAIFTAPVVDANAAEALRRKMLARHDAQSQQAMQVLVEASRVLTPEQRTRLAERAKARGDMMLRHHQERASLDARGPAEGR